MVPLYLKNTTEIYLPIFLNKCVPYSINMFDISIFGEYAAYLSGVTNKYDVINIVFANKNNNSYNINDIIDIINKLQPNVKLEKIAEPHINNNCEFTLYFENKLRTVRIIFNPNSVKQFINDFVKKSVYKINKFEFNLSMIELYYHDNIEINLKADILTDLIKKPIDKNEFIKYMGRI